MRKLFLLGLLVLTSCHTLGLDSIGEDERKKRDAELQKEIDDFKIPTIEKTLYEGALEALEKNEYQKAEQYLLQLMKDNPTNPLYLTKYAELGRKMGKCKTSLAIYDQLIAQSSENLDYLEGKGLCQLEMGEFKQAGKILTEVIDRDPQRWRAINGAGLIFISRQKYSEANQYFALASEISGENPTVLNNMGLSKALVGNYVDAIAVLKKASERSEDVPEQKRRVDLNLALVYGISGDTDSAKRAAAPHLTEPQLYNNLGIYSELSRQPDLAKTYLNKALSSTTVYYEKAWENLENVGKTR